MPHPFIPAANTAKVELVFNQGGVVIENVFNVKNPAVEWNNDALTDLIAGFTTWLETDWVHIAGGHVSCYRIDAADISHDRIGFVSRTLSPAITGIAGGTGLPRNVTVAMKWDTGHIGRSFRGRTFHVGLTTAFFDGSDASSLAPTTRDLLIAKYALLETRLQAHQPENHIAVVSYVESGSYRADAVVSPVTGVGTDFRIDTIRRRMIQRNP